jgi:hypothetical protein
MPDPKTTKASFGLQMSQIPEFKVRFEILNIKFCDAKQGNERLRR